MNNINKNSDRSEVRQRLKQLQHRCDELEALLIDMRRIAQHESNNVLILMMTLFGTYVLVTHFDFGLWGFVIAAVTTAALFHWGRRKGDDLPFMKLSGVINMAGDYALLITLKKHQDASPVTWSVIDVNVPEGNQVVTLDGFDPLSIEVLRAEEDSLQTLMSLSPSERKKKYAAAKEEVIPLIHAGQIYAKEMGVELEYWLRKLA